MSETTDEVFYKRILAVLLILGELLLGFFGHGAIVNRAWGYLTMIVLLAVILVVGFARALTDIGSE